MPSKLTIDYIKNKFNSEGYKLLSNEYLNNRQILEYICPNGHHHKINWGRFQQGKRCPYCSGERVHYDDIKNVFEERGYTLLSQDYKSKEKLTYRCPNGHIHDTDYYNFKKGHGCPECAGQIVTYKEVRDAFEKENYILLSKTYLNNFQNLDFICPMGHKNSMTWASFKSGHRCSECSFNRKYSIEEIKEMFKSEGLTLLTSNYINSDQKLEYICKKGNKHYITLKKFNWGQRCKCFKKFKGEERIEQYLIENRIDYLREFSFKNCKYKQVLPFDFYLPDLNICIEYDGIQHFEAVEYFGGEKRFKENKIKDSIKTKYCLDNNIKLIRIPYWEFDNIENILKQQL